MHHHLELDIDLPRGRVIDLFLDPKNLLKWQPDLVSVEPIGPHKVREAGAKSRQVYKMGRREVEIIETITVYNSPEAFSATYETDGVWKLIENRFVIIDERQTRWFVDAEFKCSGIVGLMAFIMPGMFKTKTFTFMKLFKDFAEHAGDDHVC